METHTYITGVEATVGVTDDKWKPIILCNLRHGITRPNDLKRGATGISQKMLIQQLRGLEEGNIIEREVHDQVPLRVKYYLSNHGQSLSIVSDSLCNQEESHVTHLQEQGQEIHLKCEDQ